MSLSIVFQLRGMIEVCVLVLMVSIPMAASVISYQIDEESMTGSLIGDLVEDSGLRHDYDPLTLSTLRFQFLTQPAVNLSLDTTSGMIFTSGRLDRESVCAALNSCVVRIDVAVRPVEYFRVIKAALEIIDINDNSPTFPRSTMNFMVLESAPVFTTFLSIPEAWDPDRPSNSVQRYELIAKGQDTWRLEVQEHSEGERDVRLVLSDHLDREAVSTYDLTIIAYDGGIRPRSGSVRIHIQVADTNDNIPIFEQTSYEVSIDENIQLLKPIIQVRATDRDEGVNGLVVYSLSERSIATLGHVFGIDNSTGVVYAKSVVDYELGAVYRLTIVARDQGAGSLAVSVPLIVHVNDLNDHAPVIVIHTLRAADTNASSISEDAPLDTFVAHVEVSDPDGGSSGQFTCSLQDTAFRLLTMPDEYRIVSSAVLDRERMSQYNLALVCVDQGTPPLTAIKNIHITITDINDNAPAFKHTSYEAEIEENSHPGEIVTVVNATDADEGINGDIVYSMGANMVDVFRIDPVTGIISAVKPLDRESHSEYILHVTARDRGNPSLNDTALVLVRILDVNDEAPKFIEDDISFGVRENQEPGSYVGTLRAEDDDDIGHNEFIYELLPDASQSEMFTVDRHTGEVRTLRELDREEREVYHLVAVARDVNLPTLSSIASFSIDVLDENDNYPKFLFPVNDNHTVLVPRDAAMDLILAKVQAYDADWGRNAEISFNISGGHSADCFEIHPSLGTITVRKSLANFPENTTIRLQLSITDHGEPILSASTFINLVLQTARPGLIKNANFLIVTAVGCISGLLIVVLLIVIIVLLRKQKIKRNRMARYNCRTQALHRPGLSDIKISSPELHKAKMAEMAEDQSITRGSVDDNLDTGQQKSAGESKDMSVYSSQQRLELSHLKSQQWLASLDVNSFENTTDDVDGVKGCDISASERGQADGQDRKSLTPVTELPLSTIKHWPLPRQALSEEESSSLKSGEGSNVDSGRGASEAAPLSKRSDSLANELAAGQRVLHTLQTCPSYQPPQPAPCCQTFSSFRGPATPASPSSRDQRQPCRLQKALPALPTDSQRESSATAPRGSGRGLTTASTLRPINNHSHAQHVKDSLIVKNNASVSPNKVAAVTSAPASPRSSRKRSNNLSTFTDPAKSPSSKSLSHGVKSGCGKRIILETAACYDKPGHVGSRQAFLNDQKFSGSHAPSSAGLTDDDGGSSTSGSYMVDANELDCQASSHHNIYRSLVV